MLFYATMGLMLNKTQTARRASLLLALAVMMPMALSACSSGSADVAPSREAGNLGTRICLVNNTNLQASVKFLLKDTSEDGEFPPGARRCGEGTSALSEDVTGYVQFRDPYWKLSFAASNPWVGSPKVKLSEKSFANGDYRCVSQGFNVNESLSTDNGVAKSILTRLPDGQWKEFELVFRASENPSADGMPVDTSGLSSCINKAYTGDS